VLDVLRGHRREVWRLALLPDTKTLISGSKDGVVCFWDTSLAHPHQTHMILPERVVTWGMTPANFLPLSYQLLPQTDEYTRFLHF